MVDFSKLKKRRTDFSSLVKKVQDSKPGARKREQDERFWMPTTDKAGKAEAIIRFLPEADGEDQPFVKTMRHAFELENGRWVIEKCLRSIDNDGCPLCSHAREFWDEDENSEKRKTFNQRKAQTKYISNILVISDPNNPENEGKVFLYAYGAQIYKMIESAMVPEFETQTAFNPFCMWEGADFNLRVSRKSKWPTYEHSEFRPQSELYGGDEEKLKRVWAKCYPLQEFVDPKGYKTATELEDILEKALTGKKRTSTKTAESDTEDAPRVKPSNPSSRLKDQMRKTETSPVMDEDEEEDAPWENKEATVKKTDKPAKAAKAALPEDDDEDAILKRFQNLRDDDD
jgi:hypothetical protein